MKKWAFLAAFSVSTVAALPTAGELIDMVRHSSREEAASAIRETFNTYFFGSREERAKITKAIQNFKNKYGISPLDFREVIKRVPEAVTVISERVAPQEGPSEKELKNEIARLQRRVREQQKLVLAQKERLEELEEKVKKKSKEVNEVVEERSGQARDYIALGFLQAEELTEAREQIRQLQDEVQRLQSELIEARQLKSEMKSRPRSSTL